MPYFDGFGGGFWLIALLGFLVWLVFVGGLITLIVLGIRWLLRNTRDGLHAPDRPAEDTALATLRERFARGEIDAEEYEARRRTLGA
jgi:putative membrane protein